MKSKFLIVIAGPTAVGKTSLAILSAKKYETGIISADSRQVYREMTIGTAKPTKSEQETVPMHCVNRVSIHDEYNVGLFEKEALDILKAAFEKLDIYILCGGTGMYIKALCEGLDVFPDIPEKVRQSIHQTYETEGLEYLRQWLQKEDPGYYASVDSMNPHRLIRALSVIRHTGQTFSSFLKGKKASRPFKCIYVMLDQPRDTLYDKINARVDLMLENGLENEARNLYPHKHLKALQTVGYSEMFDYFEGRMSFEEAVNEIKKNTRRYAKRQLTWFRKYMPGPRFHPEDHDSIHSHIEKGIGL